MKNGLYILVIAPKGFPGKLYRGRYAYEHTVKIWETRGALPGVGFEIHHINGNHCDNSLSNLKIVSVAQHRKIHAALSIRRIKFNCGFCGTELKIRASDYRRRLKASKYGKIFCSAHCGSKHWHSVPG